MTPYRDVSTQALGSVSRAHYDAQAKALYAGLNYPGVVSHLGAIPLDGGPVRRIADIKGPRIYTVSSTAWDPDTRTLFYTADNNAYRDLLSVDPAGERRRTLIRDARIGEIVFDRSDRSLWGIRTLNGIATLVKLAQPYADWTSVHAWPYGEVVYDLDVSPDGKLLSLSVGDASGRQKLLVLVRESLLKGDATPATTFEFGSAIPSNFVFSPDGRYLFGSSYYTGVSNIFRFEIATRALEAVSNAETGFFRPIPLSNDELIVFRFTGQGFVPARIEATPLADVNPIRFLGQQIAEEHPVVKDWKLGSPASVPFDSLVTRRGSYASLRGMRLESAYPVVQGYKDFAALGLRANFSDPVMLNRASLTASYTPDGGLAASERYHVQARVPALRLDARVPAERGRFLRPRRPDAHQPQGLRHWRRLAPHARLRPAAAARPRARCHVLRQPRAAPRLPGRGHELHGRARDARAPPLSQPAPLARLRRRGEGRRLGPRLRGRPREGRLLPEALRQPRPRDAAPAAPFRRSGCAPRLAARWAGRATSRSRTSTSAASATTGSTGARSSATASPPRSRDSRSTRSAGRNYAKAMLEWSAAAAPLPPASARRASTLTWARPAALRQRRS